MTKTVFLDTNIFLRLFVKEGGKQYSDCSQLFTLIETSKIKGLICSVVLLEIYFTLNSFYKFSPRQCQKYLTKIISDRNIKIIDDFDYNKALDLFIQTKVKFTDCLIASLGFFETNKQIISYDKDFDRLKFDRLEPSEII
ncbi:MAG: PIN domain-containing protein [Candidatus Woesebacteria bacterium]|nr:PIN domain-containing protein [Candidatus Woesebacteria bacterium]